VNYARRVWNSEIPGDIRRLNELSYYSRFLAISYCADDEATSWRRKSLRPEGHREVAVGSLFLYGRLTRKTLGLAPYDTDDFKKPDFGGGRFFKILGTPFLRNGNSL
jgi:hypothetical protein